MRTKCKNAGKELAATKPAPAEFSAEAASRSAEAQLQRVLPQVSFKAVSLSDCVDFLRDVTGLNIFVDWKNLERAGINQRTPITLDMRKSTAEQVLNRLLQQAGTKSKLDFDLDEGVVQIATEDQVNSRTFMRIYDVVDLFPAQPTDADLTSLADSLRKSVAPQTWRENGGAGGTIMSFGSKLIVTASAKTHRQIATALEARRELKPARGR